LFGSSRGPRARGFAMALYARLGERGGEPPECSSVRLRSAIPQATETHFLRSETSGLREACGNGGPYWCRGFFVKPLIVISGFFGCRWGAEFLTDSGLVR